jgi:hypothetical protein
MTGLVPLVASPSGGLRRGWLMRVQLKSWMTKCRLATVIFCFVTFVCTERIFDDSCQHLSILQKAVQQRLPLNSNRRHPLFKYRLG